MIKRSFKGFEYSTLQAVATAIGGAQYYFKPWILDINPVAQRMKFVMVENETTEKLPTGNFQIFHTDKHGTSEIINDLLMFLSQLRGVPFSD